MPHYTHPPCAAPASLPTNCKASQVKAVVEGPPLKLIEAVAERAAADILSRHPAVVGVRMTVRKPHVAVPGIVGSLGALRSARCICVCAVTCMQACKYTQLLVWWGAQAAVNESCQMFRRH